MKYEELFSIKIGHKYFSQKIEHIHIEPAKETIKLLKQKHFLQKNTTEGIKVFMIDDAEKKIELLSFYVFITSNDIKEITKINSDVVGEIPLFFNEKNDSGVLNLKQSVPDDGVSYKGFKAVAKIVIDIAEINDDIPEYQLVFNTKSIKWKYYFVTNKNESNLEITSLDEQLDFKELPDKDQESKANVASLQLIFPDAQITVFESNNEIGYTQKPRKNISLFKGDDQLITHLPNPKVIDQGAQVLNIMTVNSIQ